MANFIEKFLFSSILAITVSLVVGCGDSPKKDTGAPKANAKPRIVATTTMLADMARQIAGDEAEVISLMAPGVDPHSYELPARAIGQLNSADLVVYNGVLLEGKMEEMFEALASRGKAIVAAAESLPDSKLIVPKDLEGAHGDPHVWGDVSLWKAIVPAVLDGIQSVLPEEKHDIAIKNATKYTAELTALDFWIKGRLTEVPMKQRLLLTSHDAFSYLGRAYEVEVVGVQGISTATDAGIADIVSSVDLIKKRGIKAIFVESSVSSAAIERISKDAGVRIGGELYSDSCGPAGEIKSVGGESYDVGTYIGMMKHNVNTIVEALKP